MIKSFVAYVSFIVLGLWKQLVLTCIQKPIDIVAFLLVLNFLPLGHNKKSTVTFAKDSFGKMAQTRQEKKNPRIFRSREDSSMVPKYR